MPLLFSLWLGLKDELVLVCITIWAVVSISWYQQLQLPQLTCLIRNPRLTFSGQHPSRRRIIILFLCWVSNREPFVCLLGRPRLLNITIWAANQQIFFKKIYFIQIHKLDHCLRHQQMLCDDTKKTSYENILALGMYTDTDCK